MISEKIDVFLAAGRELNFSEAARKNYTTQPTVSRLISDLEAEWGMKLFIRSNKGLRLTPEGAVMLDCCKKMERMIREALKKAGKGVGKNDRLRLGFITEIDVERQFIPVIENLSSEYPDLDLSLSYGSFGSIRKGLQKDELDIAFTFDFEIPNYGSDVVIDHIRKLTPCLAISANHPLYGKESLNIRDFSEEIFYLPEETDSPGREKDMHYILRGNRLKDVNIRFSPNVETALLQARLGRGVALVNDGAPQIDRYRFRTIPLQEAEGTCHLSLVAIWKKDNLNPFIARFMTFSAG